MCFSVQQLFDWKALDKVEIFLSLKLQMQVVNCSRSDIIRMLPFPRLSLLSVTFSAAPTSANDARKKTTTTMNTDNDAMTFDIFDKVLKKRKIFFGSKICRCPIFFKKNIIKFFSISLSWSTLSNYLSMVNWPICRIRNVQSRLFKLSLSFSFTFFTSFAQFNSFAS